MTLNELMLGNIQSNQGTAVMQLGAQTTQKSSSKDENSAFSGILNSKISDADIRNRVSRNDLNESAGRKSTEPVSDKAEYKPKYLTFREANEKNEKASSSELTVERRAKLSDKNDIQLDEVDEASKNEKMQTQTPGNLLQIFAQVLGLDIRELQKLLKEAGITSESFNNMKNISENASKLSQLLGLNSEQEDTLVKMLQLTGETLDSQTAIPTEADGQEIRPLDTKSVVNSAETAKTAETQPSEKAGKQEVLSAGYTFETLTAKLNLKMKVKLNELGNKLEVDQSAVKSELKQLIQPLLEKAFVKIQELVQQVDGTIETKAPEQTAAAAVANADAAPAEDDGAGQEANAKSEKEAVTQQPVQVAGEVQTQATFAVVQPDKVSGVDVIDKAASKVPVAAKEIISQVIEKAKVILTPDKSEMLLDLKPDSLGKISLKVVTENGMVMAKFVAESQQVKQVLEANMQLLKDSLEKQGMSVQGFSVSVRQDSNRSARNWTQPESSKNRSFTGTAYGTAGIEGSLVENLETTSRSNPYKWGSSTINLTA